MDGVCERMMTMHSKPKPKQLILQMMGRLEAPIAGDAASDDVRGVRADDDDAF